MRGMTMLTRLALLALLTAGLSTVALGQASAPIRLYVFDGGTLESDPTRYRLQPQEVQTTQLAITAFLVVHPRGTLMWDTGGVADDTWVPGGQPVARRIMLSDGRVRPVSIRQSLTAQLAAAGYAPSDITHLALSHYHWDHVANANLFAGATWLARPAERAAMFPPSPPVVAAPSTFAALRNSQTVDVGTGEHDVFGDGTVLLLPTPGHTDGHQALYVRLASTGGVVLTGDLYHYPEERTLNRLPTADVDVERTRASREWLDAFLTRTGASLWIQHDLTAMTALRKSPAFYD
ncbi:MAG: N-acyl homoserine lactonase family protein [Acidobacteria bacterium]|nr:N-acyl homoserine lactonase family protein [Acidobacteriota bacterium]